MISSDMKQHLAEFGPTPSESDEDHPLQNFGVGIPVSPPSDGKAKSQETITDQDPKGLAARNKPRMSTVPVAVLREIAGGMGEGADKYGFHNWRHTKRGVNASVYYDATMRHLLAWIAGEDIDPDSGINHITKAITSLVVLRDASIHGNVVDDRPPKAET